jgi:maleylpyruvate isomerase
MKWDQNGRRPATTLQWMMRGDSSFREVVDRLSDDALVLPSKLPGWSRAMVVTHVARNAGALTNLLTWACTGIETPMYASSERRLADLENGASRPAQEIRADLVQSDLRLLEAVASLTDEHWSVPVKTARGREIRARDVPWLRVKETWIHGVDMNSGWTFDEFPRVLTDALLEDVTGSFVEREDCPNIYLVCTDQEGTHTIGSGTERGVEVRGTSAQLLAWLVGRDDGQQLQASSFGAKPPALPEWL